MTEKYSSLEKYKDALASISESIDVEEIFGRIMDELQDIIDRKDWLRALICDLKSLIVSSCVKKCVKRRLLYHSVLMETASGV